MGRIEDVKMMVQIAEMYYNENMTQQEIAQKLGLSRSKVFRYLQECIKNEIVTITVNDPFKSSSQLESFFKNRYSLTDVIIVPSTDIAYSYPEALKSVGAAAANYLSQALTSGCILGVEWGMTAYNISQAFTNNFVKDVFVVQLLGCSYQSKYNTDNVVAEFARKLHTVPFTLPFPVIVENLSLAEVLRKESRVAQIFGLYEQIDIALLTVGEIGVSSTNYIEGFVSKEEMRELVRQGAVGDICGRYLDINGNICHHELYQRAVSIDFEQIRKIKMPILVANGPGKVKGILGALNSNLCKVLITDEYTANMMMNLII